jgi:hypothetical protein
MAKLDISDHTAAIPFILFAVFAAIVAYAIIKGNKKIVINNSTTLGLIGKTVRAKYTGKSGLDIPTGGADMPSPLKNGETLQGTITSDGLKILQSGGIAGFTPMTIPNGQFEVISVVL